MLSGEPSTELITALVKTIRTRLSARHVPALILPIADIPYTINGKKVEVAVKKAKTAAMFRAESGQLGGLTQVLY